MNNGSHLQDRDEARSGQAWRLLFAAWSIALAATLGALFIGEVMGQRPCTLCWHQRAFMFPLAVVLAVACFRSDPQAWRYALPLAGIGRSEERRVGKECVSTCSSRWVPYH